MHALVLSLQKGTSTCIYSTFQICCSQCQYLTRPFFITLLLPRRIKLTASLHKQAGTRMKFFDRATAQRIETDRKSVYAIHYRSLSFWCVVLEVLLVRRNHSWNPTTRGHYQRVDKTEAKLNR